MASTDLLAPTVTPNRLRTALLTWVPTLLFNIVLPIVTYEMLTDRGVGTVPALLWSGAWPLLETALSLAIHRRIDEFSLMVLIFLVLSVVAALGFNSPRLLVVKESAVNGLFGVVLLVSLLAPRPLMFYLGRRFATNGTPESIADWNVLWQYPGFRRTQRVITTVWGVTLVAAALVQIGLSYVLSTDTMVVVFNVLPYVVFAALIFWTITYGNRARARGEARARGASPDGDAGGTAEGNR
jgi:hypothetical protein